MGEMTVAVLGGDARQVSSAERLVMAGYHVNTWGLPETVSTTNICQTPMDAIANSRIWLLPIPLSQDRLQLSGTDLSLSTLLSWISPGIRVFCGKADAEFVRIAEERGAKVIDFSQDEVFMLRNARPTAEGAVAIAMHEMRRTLFGSHALVIGYGRIGKILSDLLVSMGVKVTVSARKETDLTMAELQGCYTLPMIKEAEKGIYRLQVPPHPIHLIFNTVPVRLVDEEVLATLPNETVLIDLASSPGGIDYDCAHRLGLKTVIALALPGKVAPITAGEIIADYLISQTNGGLT